MGTIELTNGKTAIIEETEITGMANEAILVPIIKYMNGEWEYLKNATLNLFTMDDRIDMVEYLNELREINTREATSFIF